MKSGAVNVAIRVGLIVIVTGLGIYLITGNGPLAVAIQLLMGLVCLVFEMGRRAGREAGLR